MTSKNKQTTLSRKLARSLKYAPTAESSPATLTRAAIVAQQGVDRRDLKVTR